MNLAVDATAPIDAGTDLVPSLAAILAEAERQFGVGQTDEARQYLEDVRRRFHESGDANSEGAVLRSLANLEFSLDRSREAERYLELACERYGNSDQRPTASDLHLSLGDVRSLIGDARKAREAYLKAAKLYRTLDDPLGQAHAEFKLGTLHAASNQDIAQRHYHFAATLYDRATERLPASSHVQPNGPLPEQVQDCRQIDAWTMARLARREAERLRPEVTPVAEEKIMEAAPAPAARSLVHELLVFAVLSAAFSASVLGVSTLLGVPWSARHTVLVTVAVASGALSVLLARMNGVTSPAARWIDASIAYVSSGSRAA